MNILLPKSLSVYLTSLSQRAYFFFKYLIHNSSCPPERLYYFIIYYYQQCFKCTCLNGAPDTTLNSIGFNLSDLLSKNYINILVYFLKKISSATKCFFV